MLNLFKVFAISILVPTPSVQATIFGFFKFLGILLIEPKLPILLNFFLPFFLDEILEIRKDMSKSNVERERYRSEKARRERELQQRSDKWLRQDIYKGYLRRKKEEV